ncbi:MAG: septation protein IspZ [Deltaproteobacteria bacterium]|nr:septation protein IspZ [Deltaproteobacteria bacterium]
MRIPLHVFLLQLLPILVFLVVDGFVADPVWAIGAALVFVVFQSAVLWVRKKKLDPFIAVDAVLVCGMGAVSLLAQDDFFFKLKPAVIEGVMVPYLVFLALAPRRWLDRYFDRYLDGVQIPEAGFRLMRRLMIFFAAGVLIHAGLVVWAALAWSRQTWGWISGPGFYLLLVPVAGWTLVQRIRMRRKRPRPRLRLRPRPEDER